jgi:hypothetical protein
MAVGLGAGWVASLEHPPETAVANSAQKKKCVLPKDLITRTSEGEHEARELALVPTP